MRHGTLTIRGSMAAIPGYQVPDLKHEVEHVARILRQKPDVHEVILDVRYA